MNDADLEKLTIEPGKLSPAFHRTITKYDIILESATKEITINPITSDINSSWTIVASLFLNLSYYSFKIIFIALKSKKIITAQYKNTGI